MKNTSPSPSGRASTRPQPDDHDLIPCDLVAARHGYGGGKHFRRVVAPSLGLFPLQRAHRWYFKADDVDATWRMLRGAATTLSEVVDKSERPVGEYTSFVKSEDVARRFGFKSASHFRRSVGPRLGLSPIRVGGRTCYATDVVNTLLNGAAAVQAEARNHLSLPSPHS
jgi:AraC-like DNA-binding protein